MYYSILQLVTYSLHNTEKKNICRNFKKKKYLQKNSRLLSSHTPSLVSSYTVDSSVKFLTIIVKHA